MKKLTALILTTFLYFTASSQCLPDGITFTSQAQIDNFPTDYPDCTEIEGFVNINGEGITNLNGLSDLHSIGEYLWLQECYDLTSLSGLSNLDTIGGWLSIDGSSVLTNLQGLEGINYLTYLGLSYNWGLTSLEGLNNLDSIEGCLYFQHNGLIDFSGLDNLKKINGCLDITWHDNLVSFSGLSSLQYVGDYFWIQTIGSLTSISALSNLESIAGSIFISETGLTSLEGLDNITPSSIANLSIYQNGSLSTCNVESICNYLLSPSGTVNIYNNAEGCNSPPEIAMACGYTMPCLPYGNYYFKTQEQINNFQTDYPNCSSLKGNVRIQGFEIDSLNGLIPIKTIGGNLEIFETSDLISLDGLDSLNSIGNDMYIGGDDFWPTTYAHNYHLSDISSLINLKNVSGDVIVKYNFDLQSLLGLDNMTNFYSLEIVDNEMLSYCHVKSVCDYLSGSGAEIYANDEGCNSEEEVEYACLVGVTNEKDKTKFSVFPNPFTTSTTFEYTLLQPSSVQITIFNHFGEQVAEIQREQSSGKQQVTWNAEQLPSGVYFYRLHAGEQFASGKMLLVK